MWGAVVLRIVGEGVEWYDVGLCTVGVVKGWGSGVGCNGAVNSR